MEEPKAPAREAVGAGEDGARPKQAKDLAQQLILQRG